MLLIVFLNLLIALISDIFDKIHENMNNNLLKELTEIMVETELMISRDILFKHNKYIIILEKQKGSITQNDIESKLAVIKQNLDLQVANQNEMTDKITKNLENHITKIVKK